MPKAKKDIMLARAQRGREIVIPPVPAANYRRRRRLEADPAKWLRHYLRPAFPLAFGAPLKPILEHALAAIETGGMHACAAPRGYGKTTLLRGLQLWALLSGRVRFAVLIGKATRDTAMMLDGQFRWLCTPRIVEDYPEVATPFVLSHGRQQRLAHYCDARTHEPIHAIKRAEFLRLPDTQLWVEGGAEPRPNPAAGAIIWATGLTADGLRGVQYTHLDGSVMRPDLVLIDDPQTRESAKSAAQTQERHALITQDARGMGEAGKPFAMLLSCTCIYRGDLADRMLDPEQSPEWTPVRFGVLGSLPDNLAAWKVYGAVRVDGIREGDHGAAANAYYREHRAELDAGAAHTWPARRNPKDVSAIQTAMNAYLEDPAFFWSELQNRPQAGESTQYDLRPETVASRVNGLPAGRLPDNAVWVSAFTDINYSGLHWTVAAFARDMSASVVAYGRTPQHGSLCERNASEAEVRTAISRALHEWFRALAGLGLPYRAVGIDAGFEAHTVRAVVEAQRNALVFAARGYASQKYRPGAKTLQAWERCHLTESPVLGRYVAHDSDHWREIAQRGFLVEPGAPGSVTLYGDDPRQHRAYAEQICGETLAEKVVSQEGTRFYRWTHRPGSPWDWLDSLAGCFVGAATAGLTSGGIVLPRPVQRRETRKPIVQLEV